MNYPYEIKKGAYTHYLSDVDKALDRFEECMTPILEKYISKLSNYGENLKERVLELNFANPMLYTQRGEYFLYMLQVEYANRFWEAAFNAIPIQRRVLLLPRCLSGPNFDNFKVKKTKWGWHEITSCKDENNLAWKLVTLSKHHKFKVFITMGKRFNEPNFTKVFTKLRKKFGNFGLVAVACLPELALGRTFIMEMGIPTQAIPLLYSGCAKWHGSDKAISTTFDLNSILEILNISEFNL